jgi:catechol 2,3-dioxygenase-like lactoylglutathione lyase family enzyme
MQIEAIDHVILPVTSLDTAAPWERLGLRLTLPMRHANLGTQNRTLYVGGAASRFYVEFLALAGEQPVPANLSRRFLDALREPKGLFAAVLRVADIEAALADLRRGGLHGEAREVQDGDGRKICDIVPLPVEQQAGTALSLVQYTDAQDEPVPSIAPLTPHSFPLKRLDHLAAVAPDLEAATRFWMETLGVPVWGEVVTTTTVIRQMKMGDAIFELLGPATPDSPLLQRPPGLISMVAVEVADLDAAVKQARAAGFTAPDPATGVLPGTRTATIPSGELGGMSLQLLEYV